MDEIYKEYEELVDSGFVSGARLGGKKIDPIVAIEKRRWLQTIMPPGGKKLGGSNHQKPLKELIREAAIRRQRDSIWCSTHEHNIDPVSSPMSTAVITGQASKISTTSQTSTIPTNNIPIQPSATTSNQSSATTYAQASTIPLNQTVTDQMQSEIIPNIKKRHIHVIDLTSTVETNPKPKKREYIVLD